MLPSPAELEYFLEVSQTRNISRAAERLGITQPSLSLAVRRLEDCVGCQLLVRTKAGVQLTTQGRKLQSQARSLLDHWRRIRSESQMLTSEVMGRYTFGCHASVALYSLKHFLPQLLKDYPQLEIHLRHDLSRKITEEVISFNLDFAIVVNPVPHPDLIIRELVRDRVTLFTSPRTKSAYRNQPENTPLILDPNLIQTQTLLRQLKKMDLNFPRIVESSQLEVIRDLVSHGAGIGVLPKRVAHNDKSSALTQYLQDGPAFVDRICLIHRVDSPKTAASQKVLSTIEKSMKTLDDSIKLKGSR